MSHLSNYKMFMHKLTKHAQKEDIAYIKPQIIQNIPKLNIMWSDVI